MSEIILPGATLGVLGSGQLGRMFAIAARRLGYRVHVYSPDRDTPAGQVADREFTADYDDIEALSEFARSVRVVTFEFENVPAAVTDCIEQFTPVRPSGYVLAVSQNRIIEKSTLRDSGIPVPGFRAVRSLAELQEAASQLGTPSVLKTASSGYDGKGQVVVSSMTECPEVWHRLNTEEAILEQFVDFECEISIVGARNSKGDFAHYGPLLNDHVNHILDVTICPADLSPVITTRAIEMTKSIFDTLDVVGVLCVEMFVTRDGDVLVNEIAPRPHNSGHLTIDSHVSCQFQQQVRAICGLPLGSPAQHAPAAMANLLGDVWQNGTPAWEKALDLPGVSLHLYGKAEPRPGRKMGHLTAIAPTTEAAARTVKQARSLLTDQQSGRLLHNGE